MKEPNKDKQKKDLDEQYKDCLITNEEYFKALFKIIENYEMWENRNHK